MPIYTYECACGQIIDVSHSIYDEPDMECTNCDGMMQRVFSAPNIQFKGSGFYSTDKK